MITISNRQLIALEALAKYKFLATSQLRDLGVSASNKGVSACLLPLMEGARPFLKAMRLGMLSRFDKAENIYYLTAFGKSLLIAHRAYQADQIARPEGEVFFFKDYHHRVATVDLHIAFQRWAESAGHQVVFFHRYFDKQGANHQKMDAGRLESLTKIHYDGGSLIADAVSLIHTAQRPFILVFELHRGLDSGRIFSQIERHALALAQGGMSLRLGVEYAYRLACVFDSEACMYNLAKRLRQETRFVAFKPLLFFKTLEQIKRSFVGGWRLFDGQQRELCSD